MIYRSKAIAGKTPQPPTILHPSLKNDAWFLQWNKYIYSTNIEVQDELSTKHTLLRAYADGKQPIEQYRTLLDDELQTDSPIPNEEYNRNQKTVNNDRTGLTHIDYTKVFNPMPIFRQMILGGLEQSNYKLRCYCENELANNQREELKFRKILLKEFPEVAQKIGTEEFIPKNQIELDMLSKIGGFKLPYEIASEKLYDITEELSETPQVRRKVLLDLIDIGRAAALVKKTAGTIRHEYINVDNVIVEYSNDNGFNNSRYWAYFEDMTITDLREETGWSENIIRQIADSVQNLDVNRAYEARSIDDVRYYDSYRVQVMKSIIYSVDTNYYDERISKNTGEFVRIESMYDYQPPKIHKGNTKTVKEDTPRLYESTWICGTDYVFGCKPYANASFDVKNKRPLPPIIIYKLPTESSIVENAIPALDQIALGYYKFQNAMAVASPQGTAYDLTLLENINFDGKDWSPLDLIDIRTKTGNFIYKSKTTGMPNGDNQQGNLPISMNSEAIAAINEAEAHFGLWFRNLSMLTGLDQFTMLMKTPTGETSATAINQGAATTSSTLRPILDGWEYIHKKLFYTTLYKIQACVLEDEQFFERYSNMIGKELMITLKVAAEKEPLEYGIKVVQSPSAEIKNEILNAARVAMQPKDGISALSMGEYLFIVNELLNDSGIEHARMIISFREKEAEEKRIKVSQENIKLQAEGNKELELIKQKTMIMEMGLKAANDFSKAKWDNYFKALAENNAAANQIYTSALDAAIQGMLQGQLPAQQMPAASEQIPNPTKQPQEQQLM